uniref:Uncharacterized protein n=1 Tax=Cryptosporidium parvum TaxID=5807 RepID=F0X679_CRYPV
MFLVGDCSLNSRTKYLPSIILGSTFKEQSGQTLSENSIKYLYELSSETI